jgi:hypothetical protein
MDKLKEVVALSLPEQGLALDKRRLESGCARLRPDGDLRHREA